MFYKRISAKEAKSVLQSGSAAIVDIRDITSFNSGHVQGAYHLTQETLPDFIKDRLKTETIFVMCYHGSSSQLAAQYLVDQGFEDVYSIDGGYEEW